MMWVYPQVTSTIVALYVMIVNMQNEHRNSLSISEIVETFKTNYKDIKNVRYQYEEYQAYLDRLHDSIDESVRESFGMNSKEKEVLAEMYHAYVDEMSKDFQKAYKQYEIILYAMKPGKKKLGGVQEVDIAKARSYPIENLLQFNGAGKAYCIFHNDTGIPNMHKYDNTVYCFSCNRKADVIDIYMEQNAVDFIQAVKALQS